MPDWSLVAAVCGLAVLLTAVSKGGFGAGLGTLAVPLMSLVMSPLQAAAIMLPVLCIMDVAAVRQYWGQQDNDLLRGLLPGAVLGILIGALTFSLIDEHWLRLVLGAMSVVFVAARYIPSRRPGSRAALRSPGRDWFYGGATGYTSFIAHAGGPPFNMYLLPMRLPRGRYVGTSVVLFFVINYVKLIPYGMLGQLSVANLKYSLYLLPVMLIGFRLGVWLHRKARDDVFYHACYTLFFIVGLKLIWDGVAGIGSPN